MKALFLLVSLSVHADFSHSSSKEGGERRGPPKEAVSACEGEKSGATCSFSGREGREVAGSCWAPNESLPLACKPSKRE